MSAAADALHANAGHCYFVVCRRSRRLASWNVFDVDAADVVSTPGVLCQRDIQRPGRDSLLEVVLPSLRGLQSCSLADRAGNATASYPFVD